jgi:hypothetical protein
MAKNANGGRLIGSRTVSVKQQENGRRIMAAAKRDPVTGRILPRSAAGAPAPTPPAPPVELEREEETAPAAIPFRGRLSARRPRSSAWPRTSPTPASSPKE